MNATLVGPRRLGARTCVLAVAAVALAASGCGGGSSTSQQAPAASTTATIGGSSPTATATPTPSATDQRAQAYAAAVKTYNEYWSTFARILRTGGDPTVIRGISRGEAFNYAVQTGRSVDNKGYRLKGRISHAYITPEGFVYGGSTKKPSRVRIRDCQDLRTAQFVDRQGKLVKREAGAATFVRFDVSMVNFSSSIDTEWQLDDFKTTAVESCS
jgi:hypothetical protein